MLLSALMTDILKPAQPASLPAPSQTDREGYRNLERSEAIHRALIARLPCMNRVEAPVGPSDAKPLAFPLTVAAWNLERCYFVAESAALLGRQRPDIVLLSEADNGMARTGQRHTAREIAERLGMSYAYGVEFLELDLGAPNERALCGDSFNARGFHGNAVLARAPLQASAMIRLDEHGHWFHGETNQPRVGGRCAIVATLAIGDGALVVVSVHLESKADAAYRARQTKRLLDSIDSYAGNLPVVIGGDLNTGLADDRAVDKEAVFAVAAEAGYRRHGGPLDAMTTRLSQMTRRPDIPLKLDWFLTRGLAVAESRIVAAVDPDGSALSDHEMIVAEISGLAADQRQGDPEAAIAAAY
jgi:endonuclease/exonuclease/phosphatase family metal-dependent hydrolase